MNEQVQSGLLKQTGRTEEEEKAETPQIKMRNSQVDAAKLGVAAAT